MFAYTLTRSTTYSVGRCNMVSESDDFSLLNAVVLAKLLVYFSSACCTDAVSVAHKPRR